VSAVEVEGILRREADGVATRLGHRLSSWERRVESGVSMSRCANCNDVVTVNVRRYRKLPICGAAVELRCPRRAAPEPAPARPAAFRR
jgi:hypothetical protein